MRPFFYTLLAQWCLQGQCSLSLIISLPNPNYAFQFSMLLIVQMSLLAEQHIIKRGNLKTSLLKVQTSLLCVADCYFKNLTCNQSI